MKSAVFSAFFFFLVGLVIFADERGIIPSKLWFDFHENQRLQKCMTVICNDLKFILGICIGISVYALSLKEEFLRRF